MKKKAIMSLSITLALTGSMLVPYTSFALTQAEIERELNNIQKQQQQAAKNQANAEAEKKRISAQKVQESLSIQQLLKQIEDQGEKLGEINNQIDDTTSHLKLAGKELEEAQARVDARDELLQSRVRLMYTNGFVSYIEVLLSATSFSDFLDRYHALQTIVNQDKNILEANEHDRNVIGDRKTKIEDQLGQLQTLHSQAEAMKEKLVAQEKDKEKAVMILSKKEKEFEEISEQNEANLIALTKKKQKLLQEANKSNPAITYGGGQFTWPVPGKFTITSNFGGRTDPFSKKASNHKGVDIGAPQGTNIVAAEAGVVIVAQWVNGYGNTVVLDHGSGIWTWYGHIRNNGIIVKEGATVKKGEKIAEVGSTGQSTGPHLHFEVRKNEVPIDPMPYLK